MKWSAWSLPKKGIVPRIAMGPVLFLRVSSRTFRLGFCRLVGLGHARLDMSEPNRTRQFVKFCVMPVQIEERYREIL